MTVLLSLAHPGISILNIIHFGIFLATMIGGFLIPDRFIAYYLLGLPFLFLDWQDIDRQCCFSSIVKQMQSGEPTNEIKRGIVPEIIEKIGFQVNDHKVDLFLVGFTFINWLYAFARVQKQYKIIVFPNLVSFVFLIICVIVWIISNVNIIRYNYKNNLTGEITENFKSTSTDDDAYRFNQKYPLYY